MFKQFFAGALFAASAAMVSVPAAQAEGVPLQSQIVTGFAPFAPPTGEILFSDGSRKTLADFPGELVLATVWFTTCPNCQIEMPQLKKLKGMLEVKRFYDRKKLDGLPIALDLRARNAGLLFNPDPVGTPTTFFISPTGDIVAVLEGAIVDWTAPESIAYLRSLAGV